MSAELTWDADLNFGEMVRHALGKDPDAAVHEVRAPDVYVGRLVDLPRMRPADHRGRWHAADSNTARSIRPGVQCVVMVLESPHVDEFEARHDYTPWPANGPTGDIIQRRALELAEALGVSQDTGLVLVNAIPYQCSQGSAKVTKEWLQRRDKIFAHAWARASTRSLFRARLRHWVKSGDVLVNACTAGLSSDPKLRDLVEVEMAGLFDKSVARLRMHHPAGWRLRNLRQHLLALTG